MSARTSDPLNCPPLDRIPLRNAPLVRVIAQAQFPKITKIREEGYIADFQDSLRSEYPFFEKDQAQAVELQVEGGELSAKASNEVIWRLLDVDKTWRISITTSSISIETLRYTSRKDFLDRFDFVLQNLNSTIKPTLITRIGFRYVNRIVDTHQLDRIGQLVHKEFVGIFDNLGRESIDSTISQAQCKTKEGQLVVRWGYQPAGASHDSNVANPINDPSWTLDIDSFQAQHKPLENVDSNQIIEIVNNLADRAYSFFRWTVTPDFLKHNGATNEH